MSQDVPSEPDQPTAQTDDLAGVPTAAVRLAEPLCPPTATPPPVSARLLGWRRADSPWLARLLWLWLLAICLLLLAVGWRLDPDSQGLGTHRQLGFAPCGFHLATHLPCPTCGATTAFAWAVHGQLWQAVKTQPLGLIAAVAVVAAIALSIAGIATAGVPSVWLSRRGAYGLTVLAIVIFLGSWLYKVVAMLLAG